MVSILHRHFIKGPKLKLKKKHNRDMFLPMNIVSHTLIYRSAVQQLDEKVQKLTREIDDRLEEKSGKERQMQEQVRTCKHTQSERDY